MKRTARDVSGAVRIISAAEAAALVEDGACVYFGGSGGGHAVPEAIIAAIAERHAATGHPRKIWAVSTVCLGDWDKQGYNRFANPDLLRRLVASGLTNSPAVAKLVYENKVEAYTLPQGALAQLTREAAGGRPGLITKVGLHTFVDPRHGGGRQSACSTDDLVELIEIKGEEYLLYKPFPVDVSVIRGSVADERGNITMEDEAFVGENFSVAMLAKRRGGIVIAQVQRVAAAGSLNPRAVTVPGVLVDYLVVDPEQWQTYATKYSAAYAGRMRAPEAEFPPVAFDIRKAICRRGAMELTPGAVVNIGFGISNAIPSIAAEEGFWREVTLTAEQGVIGGLPAPGGDAGAGINYDMLNAQPDQFDFYDGGGLDIAFLSFAEVDRHGNVNVSRFGKNLIGVGGFVNITQGARKVVFSGTLTAGGLDIRPDGDTGVVLARDGKVRKWVDDVEQISFSGPYARSLGQEVMFVTDRAVFRLADDGFVMTEIARGVSLERDVLGRIAFPVRVAPDLKAMDPRLFRDRPMGIAEEFRAKATA